MLKNERDEAGGRLYVDLLKQVQPAHVQTPVCPDCGGLFALGAPGDRSPETTHGDTCAYGQALDEMAAMDRKFFATHPHATEYHRKPTYADEMDLRVQVGLGGARGSFEGRVLVRRLTSDARVRTFDGVYFIPAPPYSPPGEWPSGAPWRR